MLLTVVFAKIAFGLLGRGAVLPLELALALALELALSLENVESGGTADLGG